MGRSRRRARLRHWDAGRSTATPGVAAPRSLPGIPGGVAWAPDGSPFAVVALTVKGGRIVRIDILADPDRLGRLDLTLVAG